MEDFKKLKLNTKNEREKQQKEYIIKNIEKIINDITKNQKSFKTSDIDILINYDLFDLKELILEYKEENKTQKIYIYKLIDIKSKNAIYFLYNLTNKKFMADYSKIKKSNSDFGELKNLNTTFDNYTKLNDFINRYKIDNFTIIKKDNMIILNNIHNSEIK
jgi:hypothetical protein